MFMSTCVCVCVCSTITRAIAPCIIKTNEQSKGGSLMKDGIEQVTLRLTPHTVCYIVVRDVMAEYRRLWQGIVWHNLFYCRILYYNQENSA